MSRWQASWPFAAALLLAGTASAQTAPAGLDGLRQGRFYGKLMLGGLYYQEQELGGAGLASPALLGYGDIRFLLGAQRFARRLDLRLDLRVRLTGTYDYESKFLPQYFAAPARQVSARGYLGGREFDLREAHVGLWVSDRVGLHLGRMFITEADNLKADALRVRVLFGEHWQGSLFAGGYPNPYSRSLLTDYEPPCGAGVASGNVMVNLNQGAAGHNPLDINVGQSLPAGAATNINVAPDPCQTEGPQLALVGGLTARYQYTWIFGQLGLVGSLLGGADDGGAVLIQQANGQPVSDRVGNLQPAVFERDMPRIYLSWMNQLSPTDRFDLFSDLVVDAFGSSGPSVTRALLLGNLRALGKDRDRLNLRMSYAYLSSLGVNMYLNRLLYNRAPNGTTLAGGFGIVENNLTVLRTGRHEARLALDVLLTRRLALWAEGRFRQRALLGGERNASVYDSPLYTDHARSLAGDTTVGLRDGGSLRGMRGNLSYTFLQNFRAQNHVVRLGLGGDWAGGRLGLDGEYVFIGTRDEGAGESGCQDNLDPRRGAQSMVAARLDAQQSLFLPDCFGRRSGTAHEVGLTMTANPWGRLFFLLDYRLSALLTDPQPGFLDRTVLVVQPTVIGHSLLLRVEFAF